MRAADIAMFEAKKESNSMRVFNPQQLDHYLRHSRIEQLLRQALQNNEIFMHYQPQVDVLGRLYGVESLVRWQHPELGFVPPQEFIAVAESSGLITTLGNFIIERSLSEMAELCRKLNMDLSVSINLSVRQLSEPGLLDHLVHEACRHNFPKNRIVLEITESLLIQDMEEVQATLQALHHEGFKISLDDFGTGYSSLAVLRQLPLDEIKIDKSFVDDILNDQTALKMVKNIIAIGKNYETVVLAEGVETQAQLECLRDCGCDLFQGYHFSRPLSSAALDIYIAQQERNSDDSYGRWSPVI